MYYIVWGCLTVKAIFKKKDDKIYVYEVKKDKSVTFYKIPYNKLLERGININPDNIYIKNGKRIIFVNETSAENIDLISFKSTMSRADFQTAINSKIVKDAFLDLKDGRFSNTNLLLIANIGVTLLTLFYVLRMAGGI